MRRVTWSAGLWRAGCPKPIAPPTYAAITAVVQRGSISGYLATWWLNWGIFGEFEYKAQELSKIEEWPDWTSGKRQIG